MRFVIILFSVILFISCGKNSVEEPNQPAPKDTLSSGWTKVITPDSSVLQDIFFQNNTVGYAIGQSTLWKSTDGGFNWSLAAHDSAAEFMNLSVAPNGNVFITHSSGRVIYKLMNGGTLQMQIISNFIIGGQSDVYFVSSDTGYISKASNTAHTEFGLGITYDGGNTWNFINTNQTAESYNKVQAEQLSFYNSHVGYITAVHNIIFLNNGSWQTTSDFANGGLTGIYAVSEQVAYGLTGNGRVYKTTDGGNVFSQIAQINTSEGYADLHFINEQVGYASIGHNIYQTTDGGVTWQSVLYATNYIIEIHFTDANHGWACSSDGSVFIYKKA